MKFITHYRHSHKEWIDLDKNHIIQPDLTMLSDGWFKAVTGLKREQGQVIKKINRHFYEMAVFMVMTTDLNCGDAYVPDAFIYDDPNKQLIHWSEFKVEVEQYYELAKLPTEQGKFIYSLKDRLGQTARTVDKNYLKNPYLIIENGLPILKKLPKKKEHPELDRIRQLLMNEMPIKTIVDVIVELENWLNLSVYFKQFLDMKQKFLIIHHGLLQHPYLMDVIWGRRRRKDRY